MRDPFVNLPNRAAISSSNVNAHAASSMTDNTNGIGIAEFYHGKNILIIGGTGFLGKVLIEKFLRTSPDIGKIYIVVKAKDTEAALTRLQNEVVNTELFKCLQEIHGKDYQSFVACKLVPVVGNIRECSLGIATELGNKIAEEVDIIVNNAADTTFDQRYDVAIDTNTLGPLRIIWFARRFKRLKVFLHVSTAYVSGKRQGLHLEEPLYLGETIKSRFGSSSDFPERNKAVLDIEAEIKLAFDCRKQPDNSPSCHKEMRNLGTQRAKLHGWENTYVFTKAMGEMVINTMRGQIPVVTMRPSIIESTLEDPFPGWIQGNRMMDPIIVYYGKGQMTCLLADPDSVVDVVPVDIVVNTMIVVMAKHGVQAGMAEGGHVYHVTSSTVNPLVMSDLLRFFYNHFLESPLTDKAGRPILVTKPMSTLGSIEEFVRYVQSEALLRDGEGDAMCPRRAFSRLRTNAMEEQIIHLSRTYAPFTFYRSRFDSANTEALFTEMSAQERARFHFDVRSIDWMYYITSVHIPGLRKYVLKDDGQHTAKL